MKNKKVIKKLNKYIKKSNFKVQTYYSKENYLYMSIAKDFLHTLFAISSGTAIYGNHALVLNLTVGKLKEGENTFNIFVKGFTKKSAVIANHEYFKKDFVSFDANDPASIYELDIRFNKKDRSYFTGIEKNNTIYNKKFNDLKVVKIDFDFRFYFLTVTVKYID